MHAYMVKVISISDEAYAELRKVNAKKSFTEILLQIL